MNKTLMPKDFYVAPYVRGMMIARHEAEEAYAASVATAMPSSGRFSGRPRRCIIEQLKVESLEPRVVPSVGLTTLTTSSGDITVSAGGVIVGGQDSMVGGGGCEGPAPGQVETPPISPQPTSPQTLTAEVDQLTPDE